MYDEYDGMFELDSDYRHELPLPKGLIAIVVIPLAIWLCWAVGPRIIFEMTYPTVSYSEDWSGEEVDFPAVFETGMLLQDPFGPMARAAQMFYDAPYGDPTAWLIWLASCRLDIASLWWETQALQLDPMLVLAMAVQQAIVGLVAVRNCIPDVALDMNNTLRELEEILEAERRRIGALLNRIDATLNPSYQKEWIRRVEQDPVCGEWFKNTFVRFKNTFVQYPSM